MINNNNKVSAPIILPDDENRSSFRNVALFRTSNDGQKSQNLVLPNTIHRQNPFRTQMLNSGQSHTHCDQSNRHDDGRSTHLRNVGLLSLDYTVLHLRKL